MTASRLEPPWARHPGSDRPLGRKGGVIGPESWSRIVRFFQDRRVTAERLRDFAADPSRLIFAGEVLRPSSAERREAAAGHRGVWLMRNGFSNSCR